MSGLRSENRRPSRLWPGISLRPGRPGGRHIYSQPSNPTDFNKILIVLARGRVETLPNERHG